jgi:hypothetical protein
MKEFTVERDNVIPALATVLLSRENTVVEIKSLVGWCRLPKKCTRFMKPYTYRVRYI